MYAASCFLFVNLIIGFCSHITFCFKSKNLNIFLFKIKYPPLIKFFVSFGFSENLITTFLEIVREPNLGIGETAVTVTNFFFLNMGLQ